MASEKPWHRWPAGLRDLIMQRDQGQCQIQITGCTRVATELDHKVSPLRGGPWFDPANLQAACQPCNRRKGADPLPYPAYPHAW